MGHKKHEGGLKSKKQKHFIYIIGGVLCIKSGHVFFYFQSIYVYFGHFENSPYFPFLTPFLKCQRAGHTPNWDVKLIFLQIMTQWTYTQPLLTDGVNLKTFVIFRTAYYIPLVLFELWHHQLGDTMWGLLKCFIWVTVAATKYSVLVVIVRAIAI